MSEDDGDRAIRMAEATLEVVRLLAPLTPRARERILRFVADKLAEDAQTPPPEPPAKAQRKLSAAGLANIRKGVRKRMAKQRRGK